MTEFPDEKEELKEDMKALSVVIVVFGILAGVWVGSVIGKPPKPKYLTNDQIIAEVKKCQEAGMGATYYGNGTSDGNVYNVVCVPKEDENPK
jgi:hypothetical protein